VDLWLHCGPLRAIQRAGIQLNGRLHVQSVIGEEDGGCGTLASIVRGYRADAVIIPEPTRMAIAPAQAGAHNVRITVPGLSAHGCYREEGVSAVEKYMLVHHALIALEADTQRTHASSTLCELSPALSTEYWYRARW